MIYSLILILVLALQVKPVSSIVGGQHDDIKNFRYLVHIQRQQKVCGGGLIAKHAVLTAAHCVSSPDPKRYDIRAGQTTEAEINSSYNTRLIAKSVHRNPGYHEDGDYIGADIAVILVDPRHDMQVFLKLDISGLAKEGTPVSLVGWGTQSRNGAQSPTLNSLNLHIAPPKQCLKSLFFDAATHLCADSGKEGKSGCNGDSGGPLVTSSGIAVGVVSYGDTNCYKRGSAFTRIAVYSQWIDSIVNQGQESNNYS
ncbi:hypothetical protein DSO57_1028505 [Entomophthora muscae]|uniref:Uncharacterized protein n=1 Tax=Entomophthora muscae TaxID=34485 RepID=A0ACC2RSN4_9FUNG|nr:hypothetical protein DSO57_1028505 [Entomophthora muscae]